MRIFILIALLFAFTAGSFANMAHASAESHTCAHHQMDQNNSVDNEPCHSDQGQNHDESACDDCCCVHSHSMATSTAPVKMALNVSKQSAVTSVDQHDSAFVLGLRRPPRI